MSFMPTLVEAQGGELFFRFERARAIAMGLLAEAPDTLMVSDSMSQWLATMKPAVGFLDSTGEFLTIDHEGTFLRSFDPIFVSNKNLNSLIGVVDTSGAVNIGAIYHPDWGLLVNRDYLGDPNRPTEQFSVVLIHELTHLAQFLKLGKTKSFDDVLGREKEAWWYSSFVYASTHTDMWAVPVPCDRIEDWRSDYAGSGLANFYVLMTACLRCADEIVSIHYGK